MAYRTIKEILSNLPAEVITILEENPKALQEFIDSFDALENKVDNLMLELASERTAAKDLIAMIYKTVEINWDAIKIYEDKKRLFETSQVKDYDLHLISIPKDEMPKA